MARQYNQQNPDGSWSQVTQHDDGSYTTVPIPPSGYGAANIPAGDGSTASTTGYSYDRGAADTALKAADLAAQRAYNDGMLKYNNDRLAFDKATEAWNETFKQQMALGSINGQPTEQAQNDRNTTALGYLSLLSKLTGPANAFEYAKTLTGTPGGLADIVRAAGGAYRMPSTGGGNGAAQVPLTIDSLISDVNKYTPTNGGGTSTTPSTPTTTPVAGGAPGVYTTVNGPKTLAQMHAELQTAQYGGPWDDASVLAAYGRTSKGAVTPQVAGTSAAVPANGPPSPFTAVTPKFAAGSSDGSYVPSTGPLPSPNSISPQNWNAMTPSQQQFLLGDYGNQGWDQNDVLAMFKNSLKAYGGPQAGSVGF